MKILEEQSGRKLCVATFEKGRKLSKDFKVVKLIIKII